jgi:predicted transcriptional regulator
MPSDTEEAILDELRALRREVQALKRQSVTQGRDLVPVRELAEELGVTPRTVRRRADRHGIPIRTATGAPKEDGDRSRAFVSRTEWEAEEELHTRTVRKEDGHYRRL